jgi:protein sidekick
MLCSCGLVSGFSKQVKQKVSGTSLFIQTLEEEVTYTFSVRALTIDYGPAVTGNVTTGPQEGSPAKPKDLAMSKSVSSVDMRWANGPSGKGAIVGYYIQSKRTGNTLDALWVHSGGGYMSPFPAGRVL